ncbi:MAG: response regulator transcription factor [Actinomycetota bacterium]|nr:response regulator transcription factor [Actinomycetota bacterium]
MTTLLVVSGDRLLGEAATAALAREGWDETAFAGDGLTAVATIARRPPAAVLVLGDDVPRLGAVPLVQQIRRRWPDVTVVIAGPVSTPDAVVLPPSCTTSDVLDALRAAPGERAAPAAQTSGGLEVLAGLTKRQRVVLRLLVEGLDMRAIGRELGVSEHTVRTHMQNLYARVGCHSRLELVRWATAQGLLSEEAGSSSG